ncbi:MAG: hypothetical protein EVA87_11005 [Rhodospirillaceae bacterium]|nr:MAG: hypothetical protein CBC23_005955 [Rhodospirillaceae bacterium TMED63]RZO35999.1 MAG: hypothetical protein EVA87_11005 [Rhodospirillaceae bacterium]
MRDVFYVIPAETGDLLPERFPAFAGMTLEDGAQDQSLHPGKPPLSAFTKRPPFAIMHPHKETSL